MSPAAKGPTGPDLRGRLLGGRYRIDSFIGQGGCSDVYATTDEHISRRVAVKVILPEYARSEEQRQRVRREARVGGALDHPNLTPVFDFGEECTADGETLFFLVMPLLEGKTIHGLIAGTNLPWPRSIDLIRQVLAAVGALHRVGVLHRDLKPGNCMVIRDGGVERLRVLDFGLVKIERPVLFSLTPKTSTLLADPKDQRPICRNPCLRRS